MNFTRSEGRIGAENRFKWPFLIVYCLIAILIESLFLIFIKIHLRLWTSKTMKPFQNVSSAELNRWRSWNTRVLRFFWSFVVSCYGCFAVIGMRSFVILFYYYIAPNSEYSRCLCHPSNWRHRRNDQRFPAKIWRPVCSSHGFKAVWMSAKWILDNKGLKREYPYYEVKSVRQGGVLRSYNDLSTVLTSYLLKNNARANWTF